jgi:hypothetical protein
LAGVISRNTLYHRLRHTQEQAPGGPPVLNPGF